MYRGGDFDGSAAAFMGGGFMPSQATQPPESSSFPSSRVFTNFFVFIYQTIRLILGLYTRFLMKFL